MNKTTVDSLFEELIDELNIENSELYIYIYEKSLNTILKTLTREDRLILYEYLEKADIPEAKSLIKQKIPNLNTIMMSSLNSTIKNSL